MRRAALHALLSHWMRHPLQLFAMVVGLALATGLWTGVQAINAEARSSYAQAAAVLGEGAMPRLQHPDGALTLEDFVVLRRAGHLVTPILREALPQTRFDILGIDPFTAPPGAGVPVVGAGEGLEDMLSDDGLIFVNPSDIDRLPAGLPRAVVAEGVAPGVIVTDILTAQRLLGTETLSALLVLPNQPTGLPGLDAAAPHLLLHTPESGNDIARLTDSFHLNLTAFGLLAFGVGLFIVHASIGLAFEERRSLFRTLRALGLSSRHLLQLLALELFAFALAAGVLGVVLGYLMAGALLPGVAATLSGLYGARVEGTLGLSPWWWLTGLGIAFLGTALAGGQSLWTLSRMPPLAPAMPRAWAMARGVAQVWQGVAGLVLLVAAGALAAVGSGLIAGFLCLGALLIGAALCLPYVLKSALGIAGGAATHPIAHWALADTRQQLPGLSLALMALMLALAANIGVSTMVGSFRNTFVGWLDQRLAAELYVTTASPSEAAQLQAFVSDRVDAILPIVSSDTDLAGAPGQVFGIRDHATYRNHWPLIAEGPQVWDRVAEGRGVLINEQLARREDLWPGATLTFNAQSLPVVGVYSDYGNPSGQAIIGLPLFEEMYPEITPLRFALRTDAPEDLADAIRSQFGLSGEDLVNQATVKAFSLEVFERTFQITRALNVLTLGVAGFALWASLTTLGAMRLPQLAPVWALGLTRSQLAMIEMGRTLGLACLAALFALPVGLVLAWVLLAIVNVEAFGWRLPMQVFPGDWLRLLGWSLLAAALAGLIPVRRLARIAPAELLKVFASAR